MREDRARVGYTCDKCNAKGDFEADFKHGADCTRTTTIGSGLKKVCSKSGKAPHASD